MTENAGTSENSEEVPKTPEEVPKKTEELSKKPEEVISEPIVVPKTARGRPKGAKDSAPRVKRVPIAVDPEPAPEVKRPPTRRSVKQVTIEEEEDEEQTPEQEEEEEEQAPEPEPKSPRTLRKERMKAHAAERLAIQQAKQARFDNLLDTFMGY
jgi:hypothetical protein